MEFSSMLWIIFIPLVEPSGAFQFDCSPSTVQTEPGAFELKCSPLTVQKEPGQDMDLSCAVEPSLNIKADSLECKRDDDIVHVYRSRWDDPSSQHQKFKNRTVLDRQNLEDGSFSLTLKNITKEDEGNYTCCFPMRGIVSSAISLTVGSGLSSALITVITVIGLGLGVGLLILAWKNRAALSRSPPCILRRNPAVL
ncbi:Myelin-oligodendrocyte glycoprotein [Oryzias melastigma]|uniref:Myelin-oligodendrocyte glycoprotein n=1 Tax=Oryzias melastigma TaxID=30732 RepID=A0A834F7A3_ORYME|nr:Myelin-oligodendrocyte glycoprotein [Oryzias melastigma]